jgi:2-oxoglutarate ferredoxin oxidoreductase subunit gamma
MQKEVVFAGFGGQGVMIAGQILAASAMEEGFNVVWLPSYGPEMRGGTANCIVVISDIPIASPIVPHPVAAVIMNNPSLERFGKAVAEGGTVIINSSLVNLELDRQDVTMVKVPANAIAMELGSGKAANIVALGAYVGATRAVSFDVLKGFVSKKFAKKAEFVELNLKALEAGFTEAEKIVAGAGKAR